MLEIFAAAFALRQVVRSTVKDILGERVEEGSD